MREAGFLLARGVVVLLLLAGAAALSGQSPARSSRQDELARLQNEISRLERDLESAALRRRTLREQLAAVEIELELQQRRVEESKTRHALAEIEVLDASRRVAQLEDELAARRETLGRHLRLLHGLGRQGTLRLLLSIESQENVPGAMRQMRYLAQRQGREVEAVEASRLELAEQRAALLEHRDELARWLDEERGRQAELESVRTTHSRLLRDVERRENQLSGRAEELRERESRLSKLLDMLVGNDRSAFSEEPVQGFQGILDWPVEGRVVIEFGPRLDPRYRTRIPHNGVAIAVSEEEVRPIYPGRVLFAAPFKGYGDTVVVSHAGGVLTLYAGLDELLVKKGDVVALDQALGRVSSELYFEIRDRNEPVDPLSWLR